uniref:Uncharacterized protein n=1 Tax=Sphaerodactylus townsendi TaxID=933632 RepID=A0ACB8FYJ4_9SAUR
MGVRVLALRRTFALFLCISLSPPPSYPFDGCRPPRPVATVIFAQARVTSSARFLPRYAAQRFRRVYVNGMGGNCEAVPTNNRPPFRKSAILQRTMPTPDPYVAEMSALFADTSGDMNDVLDHPIAGSSGANEGSTPLPMMELTSPERRMTADSGGVCDVLSAADFAKAMVEQGEVEAMERRRRG